MAHVRAYIRRYSLSLLNAAVICGVYVVGIAARPHAAMPMAMRIFDWFTITPEVSLALFVASVLAMASPWYTVKYLALIMPGIYAASSAGYTWGNSSVTWVMGLMPAAIALMMAYGVRMEERRNTDD